MDRVRKKLEESIGEVLDTDGFLLLHDVSERCIAARLAMALQKRFPGHSVDVEYNRMGGEPKQLGLPDECANRRDENGEGLVLPDVIIHKRGRQDRNLAVLELKKKTSRQGTDCDRQRVRAFMTAPFNYQLGVVIMCETGSKPNMRIEELFEG